MGHHISAIVMAGEVDRESASQFDVRIVDCLTGFTLIALDDHYVDAWAERLGISGPYADEPTLNFRVVHHIANTLGDGRPFAIVETDYHGGQGAQAAAVYQGEIELMSPANARSGVVNKALRLIGVVRTVSLDEFDVLGLGSYRHWDDLFDDYWK